MARIGPALAVIAAATTPNERARARRAARARCALEEQLRGRGLPKPSLLMGALIILNT